MRRKGLGEECRIHKAFATIVKGYDAYKQLDCSWFSYDASGEKRDLITGALLKAKGLKPGSPDYSFKVIRKNIAHYIYIEFKTPKGKQSPNQKLFEKSCVGVNEKYYIARSVQEGLDILRHERILFDNLRA